MSDSSSKMYANKKGIWGWMLFDWAAQPFHTLIITFIFAPYFAAYVAPDPVTGQAWWGYAMALSAVIIAIGAPIMGSYVDQLGSKKPWVAFFSLFYVIGTFLLFWATPNGTAPIFLVLGAAILAAIGAEMTTILTNSMMPNLVPRAELGKLSGNAWALGYVGGLVSLIFMLAFMSANAQTGKTIVGLSPIFGLDAATHEGDRASGPFATIWYLIFIIPLFLFTPDKRTPNTAGTEKTSLAQSTRDLIETLKALPQRKSYFAFLITSMLYRDGLNALYAFGGIYAVGVLGLSIIQIGIFGILAAFAGAIGAFIGGKFDAKFGPKPVVFTSCWILVFASFLVVSTSTTHALFFIPIGAGAPLIIFYISGILIGIGGGTIQAASRTLLVDQINDDETTEAFGLYALTGRATSFIGPYLIGIFTTVFASQRIGIAPVVVLLAMGAIGLFFVRQNGDKTA